MDFLLNEEEAKKESFSGGRIYTTGKYTGRFTKAYVHESESGSKAVRFEFISDAGQSLTYDEYFYSGRTGKECGFWQNSLMAVMGLSGVRAKKNTPVDVYDFKEKMIVTKRVDMYPAFLSGPVGIVVQMEEYKKNSGEIGERAVVKKYFDAKTGKSASEKLGNSDAKDIDVFVAGLKPLKGLLAVNNVASVQHEQGSDDFNDDIPW